MDGDKPLTTEDIKKAIRRAIAKVNEEEPISFSDEAIDHIAETCGGDVRSAINTVELLKFSKTKEDNEVTLEDVEKAVFKKSLRHDKSDDNHYDVLSAFQKSIRGSDENAALHYLARLLEGGDIKSAIRRLLVIASEDVGAAYPMAAVITHSCVESAKMVGLPEAVIPLANATCILATAPKSNTAYMAYNLAKADLDAGLGQSIPEHLQSPLFKGYVYPHDYENDYVKQDYLPKDLIGRKYYVFGNNKTEQAARAYYEMIRNMPQRKKQ